MGDNVWENIKQIVIFFNKFVVLRKIKNTFFAWPIKLTKKGVILFSLDAQSWKKLETKIEKKLFQN